MKMPKGWWIPLLWVLGFTGLYYLPVESIQIHPLLTGALALAKWYAREHVLLCLVPAFFIAGAIPVFLSQNAVMKYLGPGARKVTAYGVASVSGSVLAVCSCTVLPLFSGIYRMGAGIGPATTFLYAGPAINVLAIILTGRILGLEMGVARAIGAVVFSILIGLIMHLLFKDGEKKRPKIRPVNAALDQAERPLWHNGLFFLSLVGILVFANWSASGTGVWKTIHDFRWYVSGGFATGLGLILWGWFGMRLWKLGVWAAAIVLAALLSGGEPLIPFVTGVVVLTAFLYAGTDDNREWLSSTWGFARQMLPLLFMGVFIAGILLGSNESEGLIPTGWITASVGGNSLRSSFVASFAGAFMYFATLTEIPILQGLIDSGMGKGPALALLLAGPALSLPNMLVIRSIMGTKRTVVFVILVIAMGTLSGWLFGMM